MPPATTIARSARASRARRQLRVAHLRGGQAAAPQVDDVGPGPRAPEGEREAIGPREVAVAGHRAADALDGAVADEHDALPRADERGQLVVGQDVGVGPLAGQDVDVADHRRAAFAMAVTVTAAPTTSKMVHMR